MADALDDDYVASDSELVGDAAGELVTAEEDEGTSRSEEHIGVKRSRPVTGKDAGENNIAGEEQRREKRKRKLKQQDQARKAKKAAANLALEPGALGRMPRDMQADHLYKLMRSCKAYKRMSDLELDEVGIKETMIADTSTTSTMRALETAPAFVRQVVKEAAASVAEQMGTVSIPGQSPAIGSPIVLFVSGNAQRAAELARALRPLLPQDPSSSSSSSSQGTQAASKGKAMKEASATSNTSSMGEKKEKTPPAAVAKLFARHFKVAEQEAFLQTHMCPVAVGTPQRLVDLLKGGDVNQAPALKTDALQAIVLDATWIDLKKRTLLDAIDTRETLFDLLAMPAIQQRLRKSTKDVRHRARLVFF